MEQRDLAAAVQPHEPAIHLGLDGVQGLSHRVNHPRGHYLPTQVTRRGSSRGHFDQRIPHAEQEPIAGEQTDFGGHRLLWPPELDGVFQGGRERFDFVHI